MKSNITTFKKGQAPWNKGTKGVMIAWNKINNTITCLTCKKEFHSSPSNKSKFCSRDCYHFNMKTRRGNETSRWMGDGAGYMALHRWIRSVLGKAKLCVSCGSKKSVQWANISQRYKRNVEDWKELCSVCHRKFDGITKLTRNQATEIKRRYMFGEKQLRLAREFGVDQGTISNIIRGKIQYYG